MPPLSPTNLPASPRQLAGSSSSTFGSLTSCLVGNTLKDVFLTSVRELVSSYRLSLAVAPPSSVGTRERSENASCKGHSPTLESFEKSWWKERGAVVYEMLARLGRFRVRDVLAGVSRVGGADEGAFSWCVSCFADGQCSFSNLVSAL